MPLDTGIHGNFAAIERRGVTGRAAGRVGRIQAALRSGRGATQDRFRRRLLAARQAAWSRRVEVLASAFDEDSRFPKRVEELAVEQLISELAARALNIAILPWASRLDAKRFHADLVESVTHGAEGDLRAIQSSIQACK